MVERHGSFVWYELMTTDMAAAATFYAYLVGWGAQDASTPNLAYTLFTAGSISVGGLMGLPEDAQKNGRDAAVDGVCRGQRRGRCCRPDQASWRGRVRPADEPRRGILARSTQCQTSRMLSPLPSPRPIRQGRASPSPEAMSVHSAPSPNFRWEPSST